MKIRRLVVVALVASFAACSTSGLDGAGGAGGNGSAGGSGGFAGQVDTDAAGGVGGAVPGGPIADLSCVQKLFDDCGAFSGCQTTDDFPRRTCYAGGQTVETTYSDDCDAGASGSCPTRTTTTTFRNASGGTCFTVESVCLAREACEVEHLTWKNANGEVVATGQASYFTGVQARCEDGGDECSVLGAITPGSGSLNTGCTRTFPPAPCTAGTCP
jgi:hypothetical protein